MDDSLAGLQALREAAGLARCHGMGLLASRVPPAAGRCRLLLVAGASRHHPWRPFRRSAAIRDLRIGARVAGQLLEEINSGATIDRHASDQIIPFASLADGTSKFQVPFITGHTETAGWLASLFLHAKACTAGRTLAVRGQGTRYQRTDSRAEDDPPTRAFSRPD